MRLDSLASLALCLIAACGGGAQKQTTTATAQPETPGDQIPKTAGPACAAVAEQLAIMLHADHAPDQQSTATAKTSATLRSQCEIDKWSDEARNCLGSVQSQGELDGCTKLLTDGQRKALAASSGTMAPPDREGMMPAEAPKAEDGKPRTRGAVKKDKGKKGDSDPDDGGE
jgi:hypothetical protein